MSSHFLYLEMLEHKQEKSLTHHQNRSQCYRITAAVGWSGQKSYFYDRLFKWTFTCNCITVQHSKNHPKNVCAQYKMTQLRKISCLWKLIFPKCTEMNGNQQLSVVEEELQHYWMLRKMFARNVKYLIGFLDKVNPKSFSVDYHYTFFRGFWKQIILNKCGKKTRFICALSSIGFGFWNIPKTYCAVLYIQYACVYTNTHLYHHNEYTIDSVVISTISTSLFFTPCHALSPTDPQCCLQGDCSQG